MNALIAVEMKHHEIEQFMKDAIAHSPASGLTPLHLYILNELYDSEPRKASDLAKAVGRAATSFTPILDVMEICGVVRREAHPIDRRAVNIRLTSSGLKLKDTVFSIIDDVERKFKVK